MSSLSPKDRVSLCQFSFADGRRCRTPRTGKNPHFCFYHAQKEARALAEESLSKDLAYFFSGDYLSACDLSTAMGRLIPAVVRGDVKPRAARTVAYMAQILLQSIQISQHEYGEAFGGNAWRQSIRNSVNSNRDYRFPPAPRSVGLQAGTTPQPEHPGQPQPQPAQRQTQPPQPAPSPHTPMPRTSAEFVQHVLAGQNSSRPPQASQGPSRQPGSAAANSPAPNHGSQPAETPANCHSESSEEPAFSSSPACHPERSEGSHPTPATQPAPSVAPTPQPVNPPHPRPSTPPPGPNRDAPWLDFTRSIRPDSKLL